ncbi:acyl-CoA carboxylase epsilon subunit [Actinospica sp.]|uniref:acyl-CoA carboxylase epsilon subunit n=1 Tax=Actinospica sp. TaxID=1872142 RepID=UPI002C09C414|nr:acyl-CoA carboxylase epsilon subunit [Actinospica sp.]HWG25459.1 acyl-CoA carboxylase epsilon subunit [Actinospica sp.]
MTTQTQDAGASVRIVRGVPSAEELAALVAVLAARSAAGTGDGDSAPAAASGWTDRARYVRSARVEFGARAGWRASALPR